MPQPKKIGTIEIDQDLAFQRRSWVVQRVGWTVMLLVTVAALLGAFGGGPLSSATVGDEQSFTVDYERFVRLHAPAKLSITLGTIPPASGSVGIWLDREWLSGQELKSIVPEPDSTSVAADRVTYHFSTESAGPGSRVEFDLETKAYGSMHGKAGIVGGRTVTFSQFSYP